MKYYTWPVTLSDDGMNALGNALAVATAGNRVQDPPFIVELKNLYNEVRAMRQKPDEIDDGIDPLLR